MASLLDVAVRLAVMEPESGEPIASPTRERPVEIHAEGAVLEGDLRRPPDPLGLVVFAHGSGSSRHSPRNRFVADVLNRGGLATVLMDLLTPDEEALDRRTAALRFDVGLLGRRVVAAVDSLSGDRDVAGTPLGVFGASTGAAAALIAAAERPDAVRAVVSRGGRPDLAGDALPRVGAPTLLVVGGDDPQVIELNRAAMQAMRGEVHLEIVPGATHLFEERGALERVAALAASWLISHLAGGVEATARAGG